MHLSTATDKHTLLVRVWPDGDFQLAEDTAHTWKSDDFQIIDLYKYNQDNDIDQGLFMQIAEEYIGPDPAGEN